MWRISPNKKRTESLYRDHSAALRRFLMMVVMMPSAGLAVGFHAAFHFPADLFGRFGLNGGVGDAMLGQLGADGGLDGGGVAVYDGVEGGVVAGFTNSLQR